MCFRKWQNGIGKELARTLGSIGYREILLLEISVVSLNDYSQKTRIYVKYLNIEGADGAILVLVPARATEVRNAEKTVDRSDIWLVKLWNAKAYRFLFFFFVFMFLFTFAEFLKCFMETIKFSSSNHLSVCCVPEYQLPTACYS